MGGTEFWIVLAVTGLLSGWLVVWGTLRYQHAVNPLLFFAVFDIGILTLLSAVVANGLNAGSETGLAKVLILAVMYMLGFSLVFLPRRFFLPAWFFDNLLMLGGRRAGPGGYGGASQLLCIMAAVGAFLSLMQASGAGLLWITDSRSAYLGHRAGVGHFYLLVQWALLASLLYYLLARKPGLTGLITAVFMYSLAAYFTGSKANFLSGWVVAGVYYYFFVQRVSAGIVLLAVLGVFGAFLLLTLLHGSYADIASVFYYFKDYTGTTAEFLMRFDEFGLHWGYGMLTDLWFYVPRALYPDKPYEYGMTLIHRVLFPGSAALGHTPGILPWALAYLDFGSAGVFLSGVATGFIRRGAYEAFLENRMNIMGFILMIQLSIMPVFAYVTLPMIVIISIFFARYMDRSIVFVN